MNEEQFEEMDRLALPLVEFLRKHGNPGQSVEITQERIRLLSVDYSHRVATTPRHIHEPNFDDINTSLAAGIMTNEGNHSDSSFKPKARPPQPTSTGLCINVGTVDICGMVRTDDICKRLAEQIKKRQSGMA